MPEDLLFYPGDLSEALRTKVQEVKAAIDNHDGNRLLNTNLDDLVAYFVAVGTVEPVVLLEDKATVDQGEARYDVRHRFEYGVLDQSRPQFVPGTRLTLHVPFSGEADLFKFKASTFSLNPPRGTVRGSELTFTYVAPQAEAAGAKQYFDSQLRSVHQALTWTNGDVGKHNASLEPTVREWVQARRLRLLDNQSVAASLGYPLRSRPDAPRTYALPDVRRKIPPAPPPASSAPFVPEPALDDAVYEQILQVLGNMVRVMEQSPDAFAEMKEEDLRTHFLVQLNGQFEGRASAETFRGNGSTDILLVERDRSVFIAECKFWSGPASLGGALDQLLDYATWRDAKAAILVFNRGADFSRVLGAVPEAIRGHPQTAGSVTVLSEAAFRSRLRQRDDQNRLLTVTTLVYNVPVNRPRSKRLATRGHRDKGRGGPAT